MQGFKLMRIILLLIGCLLLAVAGVGVAAAADDSGPVQGFPGQPQLPHSFYGTIEAAGNPVPAGVPVEARAEGVITAVSGNPVYSYAGGYGSADPFTPRLEVQGDISSGTGLTFYVGGVQAEVQHGGSSGSWSSTYPFSPGEVTELNLRIATVVTPDPEYHETAGQSVPRTTGASAQPGSVNPSSEMMLILIVILIILGIIAFYFGKRAEKAKKEGDQERVGDKDEPPRE